MKEAMIKQAAEFLLGYVSNIIGSLLPDEPDEKELKTIENAAISAYHVGRTWGVEAVESTENTLDDKALDEVLESCIDASVKYGFELNDTILMQQ